MKIVKLHDFQLNHRIIFQPLAIRILKNARMNDEIGSLLATDDNPFAVAEPPIGFGGGCPTGSRQGIGFRLFGFKKINPFFLLFVEQTGIENQGFITRIVKNQFIMTFPSIGNNFCFSSRGLATTMVFNARILIISRLFFSDRVGRRNLDRKGTGRRLPHKRHPIRRHSFGFTTKRFLLTPIHPIERALI